MKECAYCGRQNEDEAIYCRECGTEQFKTADGVVEPPAVWPRVSVIDFIRSWPAAFDELASSREMVISLLLAAWIARFLLRLILPDYGQASFYAGRQSAGWQNLGGPMLVGATFLVGPLIGAWSLVRWLRQRQERVFLKMIAWMLLAFFAGVFGLASLVLWGGNPAAWFSFGRL